MGATWKQRPLCSLMFPSFVENQIFLEIQEIVEGIINLVRIVGTNTKKCCTFSTAARNVNALSNDWFVRKLLQHCY